MIYVQLEGHDFFYDVSHLLKTFFKEEEVTILKNDEKVEEVLIENSQGFLLVNEIVEMGQCWEIEVTLYKVDGKTVCRDKKILNHKEFLYKDVVLDRYENKRILKRDNKRAIYDLVSSHVGKTNDWGILVGVRPVKIIHEMLDRNIAVDEVKRVLYESYRLSQEKIDLIVGIAEKERHLIFPVDKKSISLYLCIPFCPTTCVYCSFPSNSLVKKGKLVEPYLAALIRELDEIALAIEESDQFVDCIYIGGGTPTALNEDQFRRLLVALDEKFELEHLKEFTVEAGRSDTITRGKLEAFKEFHVDRICVNPQSMNDKTLEAIGRSHKVEDIRTVMTMAREIGFKTINMDLIAGLPGEVPEDFAKTMDEIALLKPENVTVHTLAVKTSSKLKNELDSFAISRREQVEAMLENSKAVLKDIELEPYYMYRQKNMTGNFENVGYAKVGNESLYNMRIMEERHDILALGAGSVSKMCFVEENRFERIANPKGIEDYISRIDSVIAKKKVFFTRN